MIGVIMILGSRGDIILSRVFRDNLNVRVLADTFRLELLGTRRSERSPINVINKVAYLHMRFESMYIVACTHSDANAMEVFQYLIRLLQLIYNYLEADGVSEAEVRKHFVTIQQVIDESMDYGYPQLTEIQLLKQFIALDAEDDEDAAAAASRAATHRRQAEQITIKATGATPWRADNVMYEQNQIYLDVLEDINLLLSQSGQILQCEVAGRVVVKCFLSGMPQCSVQLNDREILASAMAVGGAAAGSKAAESASGDMSSSVAGGGAAAAEAADIGTHARERREFALDDCSFHQCVRLGAIETDRAVNFVPPDGEFILMRYRTTSSIEPPFRVVNSRVQEISRSRFEVAFFLKSNLTFEYAATDVKIVVPMPKNVANVNVRITQGKAKYDPTKNAITWKIPRITGAFEVPFSAEVRLLPSTMDAERSWTRPPICMSFGIGGLALSGIKVTSLRVEEPRLQYDAKKWVRYISAAGSYMIRI